MSDRIDRIIGEREKLSRELQAVNAARFKLECRLDKLTHQLCEATGLYLPGGMLPEGRRRKVFPK